MTVDNWMGLHILSHKKSLLLTYSQPILERVLTAFLTLGFGSLIIQISFLGIEFIFPMFKLVANDINKVFDFRFWAVILSFLAFPLGLYVIYLSLSILSKINIIEASDYLLIKQYPFKIKSQKFSPQHISEFKYSKPGLLSKSSRHTIAMVTHGKKIRLYFDVYSQEDAEDVQTALNEWLFIRNNSY